MPNNKIRELLKIIDQMKENELGIKNQTKSSNQNISELKDLEKNIDIALK
jgi:hypothetical protein